MKIINEIVPNDLLEKCEQKYNKEKSNQCNSINTQFEYAWCLIKSKYNPDIRRGIYLLNDLLVQDSNGKRDYLYYLTIGHARLKQFKLAFHYLQICKQIEPNNKQIIQLEKIIVKLRRQYFYKRLAISYSTLMGLFTPITLFYNIICGVFLILLNTQIFKFINNINNKMNNI